MRWAMWQQNGLPAAGKSIFYVYSMFNVHTCKIITISNTTSTIDMFPIQMLTAWQTMENQHNNHQWSLWLPFEICECFLYVCRWLLFYRRCRLFSVSRCFTLFSYSVIRIAHQFVLVDSFIEVILWCTTERISNAIDFEMRKTEAAPWSCQSKNRMSFVLYWFQH